jgi:predicted transposase/invertase (TIGR01784 family)
MESDSFFSQLFKQLPQTLFELIELPASRAKLYRFDSVEVKKSFRIDGLFLPNKPKRPVYFLEVQFQRLPTFYANLFAKVFSYLEENDPKQEWVAVAVFPSRKEEPKHRKPYEDLLRSKRVKRVYVEDLREMSDPPAGLGLLQLVTASKAQTRKLVDRLVANARAEHGDSELANNVIELVEELLIRKYSEFDREELRMMFHLADLRKTRVWQEANEEGVEIGVEKGVEKGKITERKDTIQKCRAKGMTDMQIAELLEIPLAEVLRLAQNHSH